MRSIETVFTRSAGGGVLRHIGIALDITKEKNAEIRLQSMNEDLERRVIERTRELEALNNELEERVAARTSELTRAIEKLERISAVASTDASMPDKS